VEVATSKIARQSFNSVWAILQVPDLSVPGILGSSGMLVGLTLVGSRYSDLHLLHMGKAAWKVFEA
jgi:Asp-tRNA(Asn)/Glu-tRNA(Gln) amidotransferase A subunit family amidase